MASLATSAEFQAEVPPQSRSGFEENYFILTNSRPLPHANGYYPIDVADPYDKWGPELRTYLPEHRQPIELPPYVELRSGNVEGLVRINSNRFWWELVRVGFRLGKQHLIDHIRATAPPQYVRDFDNGLRA